MRLVAPETADADRLLAWWADPVARRFNPFPDRSWVELVQLLAASSADLHASPLPTEFRWMVEHEGRRVGTVTLNTSTWDYGTADASWLIAPEARGKGLAARAISLLAEASFSSGVLERLCALITDDNVASLRAAERAGFRHEGTFRKHIILEGRRVDVHVYGLLKEEWKGRT